MTRSSDQLRVQVVLAAALALAVPAAAQTSDSLGVSLDVRQVAVISASGSMGGGLTLVAPPEAGAAIAAAESSSTTLHYTSTVPAGRVRTIQASLSAAPPAGTTLQVQVTPPTGAPAAGACGSSAGLVTLSTSAVTVVTGIGACYTGEGATDGATVYYRLSVGNYSQLKSANAASLTVTYTLTDAF